MTNEQILKKAIEKAVKNGWKEPKELPIGYGLGMANENTFYPIIFSHDFAKAIWGEELKPVICATPKKGAKVLMYPAWQYHLQQMVLEKEPLKYIEKFLGV